MDDLTNMLEGFERANELATDIDEVTMRVLLQFMVNLPVDAGAAVRLLRHLADRELTIKIEPKTNI